MNIQIPQGPLFEPESRTATLEWFIFFQNLIAASGAGNNVTVDDLLTQVSFDGDSTSQVAALQLEIDRLDTGADPSPFDVTGTVRYVNAVAPTGVLGVSGVPYQNNGAVTLAWSGTSGGMPYFSGTTSMASTALLVDHGVIVGSGAATAPNTITVGTTNQFLAGVTGADPSFRAIVAASADLANQGTTTTVLHGNAAGNPAWGAVVLTTDVSGTLPIGNGGTGVTSLGTLTKADDTNITLTLGGTPANSLIQSVSITAGWAGQLAVARGGTGAASATAYAVQCGGTTSTNPHQSIASVGTSGQALISNGAGALPTFQDVTATGVPSYVFAFAAAHG